SSRRRHTRSKRDWSSDVCSSDLILAGLLWPALARAKQKATQAGCMSNMKQISHALQMYLDDNTDVLPGPCFSGARASYDKNSGRSEERRVGKEWRDGW